MMRMLPLDSLVEEGSKSLTIWVSPIALPPPYSLMGISSIDRWTLKLFCARNENDDMKIFPLFLTTKKITKNFRHF